MQHPLEEIGKRIYELRKHFNMTQKELCEGICTQAYISKIENGSLAIAVDILFKISERLGVDINYFYDSTEIDRIDYIKEVEFQARELVFKKDFESLSELIKREEQTPLMSNRKFKQFILWHKAQCERHLNNNFDGALDLLNRALLLSNTTNKVYSEREIEILLNKANIYIDLTEYNEALKLFEHLLIVMKKIPYLKEQNIKINLYYNLARLHLFLDNYHESIKYAKIGVRICQRTQILYGLGHLHFVIGRCYEELDKFEQALEYFQKAKFIFELNENEFLSIKALYNIKEIESSLKSQNI